MDNLPSASGTAAWPASTPPLGVRRNPKDVLAILRQHESDEGNVREQLAKCLNELIKETGMTQTALSMLFGIPQPHISELKHFKLQRFSSERLLRYIALFQRDIDIVVRSVADGRAEGSVSVVRID